MPLQNRVLPTGEIVAISARGAFTGNRGIIHKPDRTLGTSRWSHHAWICCTLEWQGRRRRVMTGRNWTELFFLDESVAMAAGHRPCGYCRREAYGRYVDAWTLVRGTRPSAKDIDRMLHASRVTRDRQQVRLEAPLTDLPEGAFFLHAGMPQLLWRGASHPYRPEGYGAPIDIPTDTLVTVLTPKPMLDVLKAGYLPQVSLSGA